MSLLGRAKDVKRNGAARIARRAMKGVPEWQSSSEIVVFLFTAARARAILAHSRTSFHSFAFGKHVHEHFQETVYSVGAPGAGRRGDHGCLAGRHQSFHWLGVFAVDLLSPADLHGRPLQRQAAGTA